MTTTPRSDEGSQLGSVTPPRSVCARQESDASSAGACMTCAEGGIDWEARHFNLWVSKGTQVITISRQVCAADQRKRTPCNSYVFSEIRKRQARCPLISMLMDGQSADTLSVAHNLSKGVLQGGHDCDA